MHDFVVCLQVAMTVLTYLSEDDVGNHGLVAIPMIVGHMSQLFIDSYISGKWAEAADKEAKVRFRFSETRQMNLFQHTS